MKKIRIEKDVLRVLTAQEARHVAGGINTRAACETAWDHQCVTQYFSCADDCTGGTASAGCPPTQNCPPPQTQGCETGNCTGTGTGTGTGTETGTGTRPPTHTV